MKATYKYWLPIILMFAVTLQASAEGDQKKGKEDNSNAKVIENKEIPFDFFSSDEPLEITLQFNMREFIRTRLIPDRNFDAKLSVTTGDKKVLSQEIQLNARGKMRRKYCSFPPVKLKIKKDKDQEQVFPKGSLKLVTHCNQGNSFETYVMKEYLVYKLYNLVTPYSFKTRLVLVNYVDSLNPKKKIREYGILIEDIDDLAKRNNAVVIENRKIGQNHMNDYEMAKVALFNYMVGNTDWSVAEQHNTKVLKIDDPTENKGIPVTYDYDYSGFVNTSYASPNAKIPITSVTERHFQGSCYSDEIYKQILSEFEALKPRIMETIEDFNYLPKAQKKLAESYINSFFKKYKREESILADLNRTCLRKD